jgi:flagellar basal-body rod modification protein FlgD
MIAGLTDILNTPSDQVPADDSRQDLGRDNFLKLFIAQLEHQDPLNPLEGQEFTAQLAQFSSLEQLYNLNDTMDAIKTSQDENSRFEVLNMIGKDIMAEGAMLALTQDNPAVGGFVLEGSADCRAVILDADGYPIREVALGVLAPGEHSFQWDGEDEAGIAQQPGAYGFEIIAQDALGENVPVAPMIKGQVSRINLEGVAPMLYVGDIPVSLSSVVDIKVPDEAQQLDGGGDSASNP